MLSWQHPNSESEHPSCIVELRTRVLLASLEELISVDPDDISVVELVSVIVSVSVGVEVSISVSLTVSGVVDVVGISSSGHPLESGPLASVSSSAQQPYSDDAQAGGGGGHPSWSFPFAAVLLSDSQQPKSVSSHGVTGQSLPSAPRDGVTASGQQP